MTVKQLKKALEKYKDDSQVVFTLPGAKHLFYADKLWTGIDGCPVMESIDAAEFEDIVGMAEQCLSENELFMSFDKSEALRDFTVVAEEIKDES